MQPSGWLIGVLLEDGAEVRREYFAVARADRSQAEWAAADLALTMGIMAESPRGGIEPVEAVSGLAKAVLERSGVKAGEVRALGSRWPRRWVEAAAPPKDPSPR